MRRIRDRLTFANVVSLIALFVALGGTAIASVLITSNSQVGQGTISGHKPPSGKHPNLIAGSVNGMDLARGAVTPGKLNTPATFLAPNLSQFDDNTGCPSGSTPWARTDPGSRVPVGYYRDPAGIVFINGSVIKCGTLSSALFQLPSGYRPGAASDFAVFDGGDDEIIHVRIDGSGNVSASGLPNNRNTIALDGITFRCAPSGQNGCP